MSSVAPRRASSYGLLLLLLAAALAAGSSSAMPGSAVGLLNFADVAGGLQGRTCTSMVGDCIDDEEEEMMMESEEISRRGLRGTWGRSRYISYQSLSRGQVPCNRRGQSYYNCQKGRRANPYKRGCTYITRCARILN